MSMLDFRSLRRFLTLEAWRSGTGHLSRQGARPGSSHHSPDVNSVPSLTPFKEYSHYFWLNAFQLQVFLIRFSLLRLTEALYLNLLRIYYIHLYCQHLVISSHSTWLTRTFGMPSPPPCMNTVVFTPILLSVSFSSNISAHSLDLSSADPYRRGSEISLFHRLHISDLVSSFCGCFQLLYTLFLIWIILCSSLCLFGHKM